MHTIDPDRLKSDSDPSDDFSERMRKMRREEKAFNRGLDEFNCLRDHLIAARRRKDYPEVIRVCHEVIALAHRCPEQQIVDWFFLEDIALAYVRLREPEKALDYYRKAMDGLASDKSGTAWSEERGILQRLMARLEKRLHG